MAALSSAALLLLMHSHQLATEEFYGRRLTAYVVGAASQSPVKCTDVHWIGC